MMRVAQKPPEARETFVFSEVYRSHAAFVWRCLRRLGVSEADVEDVCQETFMVAYAKLAEFDGRSAMRSWLFGIALRKASEYRRRRQRRRWEQMEAGSREPASAPTQLQTVARRQARALLDEVLEELDDAKRAVFVLYELEQMPMTEVAELVDCPLQTAYSRLHAARRMVEVAVSRLQSKEGAR